MDQKTINEGYFWGLFCDVVNNIINTVHVHIDLSRLASLAIDLDCSPGFRQTTPPSLRPPVVASSQQILQ